MLICMFTVMKFHVLKGFKDESDLVHYALNEAPYNNITVFTSVIFDTPNATLPPHVTYKIRQNVSMTPTTRSAQALFKYPGPRDYDDSYYKFGFLFIQVSIRYIVVCVS
ncbi:unnamed protein product [Anisakis simplex]|uniref:Oligosaccharyl transferase 48 kDa subunit n=1 Tax=Anisakis simplex TaxID=6269 RepID=A0A0M3JI65_ANISI|nr:unnamed protein product [Anisakis simplex]